MRLLSTYRRSRSTIQRRFVLALPVLALAAATPAAETYPDKTWQTKSPAQVGMKADALDALAHHVGGCGCVVRHGYLVYTWGDAGKRGDVASACKPVYVHLLIEAIEEGRIKSLRDPVSSVEPRLKTLNPNLNHKDRDIQWWHLANQISCYGVRERP
ncbi:MAG: hypothetical protein JXQ73_02855, partial [Phycisphaerae bacterium]|nr:hypothetical protein [Phycisphaerae bacterium]